MVGGLGGNMPTPQITLVPSRCVRCNKKGFVTENGHFCFPCLGELAVERIKRKERSCRGRVKTCTAGGD